MFDGKPFRTVLLMLVTFFFAIRSTTKEWIRDCASCGDAVLSRRSMFLGNAETQNPQRIELSIPMTRLALKSSPGFYQRPKVPSSF